jgi:hypothetical protein
MNQIPIAAILGLLPTIALAAEPAWQSYTNGRFGFVFSHPTQLRPGRLPENGAGLNFTDGKMSVTVQSHFLNGRTLAETWSEALQTYGPSIGYKVKRRNWFVVSGALPDGTEFYRKFYVRGDQWSEFHATYPTALKTTYDQLLERLLKGFVPFPATADTDSQP